MKIRIIRYYNYPELSRQTPKKSYKWKEYEFTEEELEECDYLVILEYPKEDFFIKVNPNNIIHICQEPPNEVSGYRQYANKKVKHIINQKTINRKSFLSHGALPWHIGKDYDFLSNLNPKDIVKNSNIVWVTSNQNVSKGHNKRITFLNRIKYYPFVKIYGRGINPINDKWDALSKSKYSIAYENYKNNYYWTEKITDSFLSFSMPLYFGCESIEDYFPKNSFLQLDPLDKHIDLYFREIINSNLWEENLDSIIEARSLILNEYQLFPFLYKYINLLESKKGANEKNMKELVEFRGGDNYFDGYPFKVGLEKKAFKLLRKLKPN